MRSLTAHSLILLSISASAFAVFTIPLTKPERSGTYLKGAPDADRARAQFFKSQSDCGSASTVPVTNVASSYLASVGIGNPPTYYNLIVDTGSSNTWCGAGTAYVRTSTSIPTGQAVNVTYGSGNFTGNEYLDQVALAPNLIITNQSIGDALFSAGFQGVDGILGVGPLDLTLQTLSPDRNSTVPTVMNNLLSQGLIEKEVLGVYFAPTTGLNDTNGALTYGGVDASLYKGELTYTPVTKTVPSNIFWGINVTSCKYGHQTIIPTSTAGIVDTGTTLVLLADDFFSTYLNAIPGAKVDSNTTGLIEIPPSSVKHMKPLKFDIADRIFSLDVAAQLIPADQNTLYGGVNGTRYGYILNTGNKSGTGLDFVLGQKFLERYYTVFDTDANRVGFAQTNNTHTRHW